MILGYDLCIASMAKKRYPVQRTGTIRLALPATSGLVHGNRLMSRWNKRLYRQGRFYQMKIDLDLDDADVGSPIQVYALRDTWGNQQAYQMAFDIFNATTAEERARLGKGQIARWQDFTVQSGSSASEMLGQVFDETGAQSALTIGEFNDTQVEDKNGNTMVFTWGSGVAGTSYGIRGEYELKANMDDSPAPNSEDLPYDQQMSDTSNVEMTQLRQRGNDAPYNADTFGDAWVKVATLSRIPGQQRLSTGYFTAPCGFALITGLNDAVQTRLEIEFKGGDYKGIHAPSMIEQSSIASNKLLGYASKKKWSSMGVSTR